MPVVTTTPTEADEPTSRGARRQPIQARSREKVERILDAAAQLVVGEGVDTLTTRAVARESGVPVASLYQYFADRDAILLALIERDTAEMDAQVASDLGRLKLISVDSMVETTMHAFVKVYERRPAFVEIYLRGRINAAIADYCRKHNQRIAADVLAFATEAGLVSPDAPARAAELAVEIGDRVFQLAYETDSRGDRFVIDEGIVMVSAYLKRFATPAGIEGIRP